MKKTYVKPMMSKESFTLSESVAVGCGNMTGAGMNEANLNTPEACKIEINGVAFFLMEDICGTIPDESEFCYNGMTGGLPVFRS